MLLSKNASRIHEFVNQIRTLLVGESRLLGDNFYSLLVLLATFSFHSVNTQNLKFGRRNRPDILASPRCEAFENLLQIDIAPVRRTLSGIYIP